MHQQRLRTWAIGLTALGAFSLAFVVGANARNLPRNKSLELGIAEAKALNCQHGSCPGNTCAQCTWCSGTSCVWACTGAYTCDTQPGSCISQAGCDSH